MHGKASGSFTTPQPGPLGTNFYFPFSGPAEVLAPLPGPWTPRSLTGAKGSMFCNPLLPTPGGWDRA